MTEQITTCQICGRAIKLKNGAIALHGYKRPRGWHSQTSSCAGARYAPYEVSRDRLPRALELVQNFIISRTEWLTNFIANPPSHLNYTPYIGSGHYGDNVPVERPKNFSADAPNNYIPRSYTYLFHHERSETEQLIEYAISDYQRFAARWENWKAPEG